MTALGLAGIALLAASAAVWRDPAGDLLVGLGNILIGTWLVTGAGAPWIGAANLTAGALMLWSWWRKDRNRVRRFLGAKSAALRAALVRTVRDRAVPVPA
jgi:hypothetical protein